MRLLFTGGGGAASEALPRLLPQHEVLFADADPSVGVHVVPRGNERGFQAAIGVLCRELAIDLLIPGCDEELRPIAIARRCGALPCQVLLPSYEYVGLYLDKLESMIRLQALGIPVPITWRRAILKPREGHGSRGVQRVGHRDGLVIQEYLEGQEYTVTMVADQRARLRAIVPVRVDEKERVTIRGTALYDAAVMEACLRIHLAMPTGGVYNVQCFKTNHDRILPIEINPRVSTTTCLAMAAGVDVIGLATGDGMGVCGTVSGILAPFACTALQRRQGDDGRWINEFFAVAA